jgi:hypothetical protein
MPFALQELFQRENTSGSNSNSSHSHRIMFTIRMIAGHPPATAVLGQTPWSKPS